MHEPTRQTDDDDATQDLRDVESISAVQSLLSVLCSATGMGFSAVARVTGSRWTAMAVRDEVGFGLRAGQDLDIDTTLCKESRAARQPIVIAHVGTDPVYANHPTPRLYKLESYVSVPIVLDDGSYFGNLCALDARPKQVAEPHVVEMFSLFAQLIATQLVNVRRRRAAEAEAHQERHNGVLREQFIAVLAHDLRNPLAAVDAGLQVLARRPGDAELAAQVLVRLGRSTRRMRQLIDDVVDYARGRLGQHLDAGSQRTEGLGEALRQVVEELEAAHPGRAIEAHVQVPAAAHCDLPRLQQLLSNLVANALVHGAADLPVRVRAVGRGPWLDLSVANGGTPIAPDLLPRLFDPFVRGTSAGNQRMGLGLFICEQIARTHGGTVEVASGVEQGTVFTVSLPILEEAP